MPEKVIETYNETFIMMKVSELRIPGLKVLPLDWTPHQILEFRVQIGSV